jgi:melanoma-associated antigen p97
MEAGDIAFLKHTTVKEMTESKQFRGVSIDQFELLCKDGRRTDVNDYLQCNWGMVPSNALVTSSARTIGDRKHYQRFLQKAVKLYSHKTSFNSSLSGSTTNNNRNNNDRYNRYNDDRFSSTTEALNGDSMVYESFELFNSDRYGRKLNLMFQDATFALESIEEPKQTFKQYLSEHENIIYDIRQCPVSRMSLCVTSDAEYEKCVKMRVIVMKL